MSYPSLTTIHIVIFRNDTQQEVKDIYYKAKESPSLPLDPSDVCNLIAQLRKNIRSKPLAQLLIN